ncbi:MAG: T9SS type A sorting domain-containing protein [Chitinophagaceae bacterium]
MRYKLKIISFCPIIVLLSTGSLFAQMPQYRKKVSTTGGGGAGYNCTFSPFNDSASVRKIQFIYPPSNFTPKAPRGFVKAVYFSTPYVGSFLDTIGCAYNVEISLGWTIKNTFRQIDANHKTARDTFISGGTTIFTAAQVCQNVSRRGQGWMRFPVTQNSFLYDTAQGMNLAVTFKFGTPFVKNYFCFADSAQGGAQQRMYGYADSPEVHYNIANASVGVGNSFDFGFDLTPLGVEAGIFSGDFSLFPNPSKGSFHIDVDALKALEQVDVTVKSITGQTVYRQHYNPGSSNFSTEINLQNAAKGMYYLEMIADGERLVRRIQVE